MIDWIKNLSAMEIIVVIGLVLGVLFALQMAYKFMTRNR